MGIVSNIGRYVRTGLMLSTLVFGAGYGLRSDSQFANETPHSRMSDTSRSYFSKFLNLFAVRPTADTMLLREITPDRMNFGRSEGLAYLMLMGHAYEDMFVVNGATRQLRELQVQNGRGLPPWNFHYDPATGKIEVRGDREANSALDADLDAAAAMIWSYQKGEQSASLAQSFMDMIWPVMNFNGEVAIPGRSEDFGNGSVFTFITHSASYISLFQMEMFSRFDQYENRDWMRVARSSFAVRKAIFEKYNYQNIPDFVRVTYDKKNDRYLVEASNDSNFPSVMGFDGIRTFWRVGVDCAMLEDINFPTGKKDEMGKAITINLRNENINLARKSLLALFGDPNKVTPGSISPDAVLAKIKGIEIHYRDERTGITGTVENRELALAAYTALAYGAAKPLSQNESLEAQKLFEQIFDKLSAEFNRQFNEQTGMLDNEVNNDVPIRYYDQAIGQLTRALIEGGFEAQPNVTRFNADQSKEVQQVCDNYRGWPFARGSEYWLTVQNFPYYRNADSLERLIIQIRQELDWLQECGGPSPRDLGIPRQESAAVQNEYRLQNGMNLSGALMFSGAAWTYSKILLSTRPENNPELVREATKNLEGALTESQLLPLQVVAFYRALNDSLAEKNIHNPDIELGLIRAMLSTYQAEMLTGNEGVLKMAADLAAPERGNLTRVRGEAYWIIAEANRRLAVKEVEKPDYEADAANRYYQNALDAAGEGLSLKGLEGERLASLELERADIYHSRGLKMDLAQADDLSLAYTGYLKALSLNSLERGAVLQAIIELVKIKKEMALKAEIPGLDFLKHFSAYTDYLDEEKTQLGSEPTHPRETIKRNADFKFAEEILAQALAVVQGQERETTLPPELARTLNDNLTRVMEMSGNQAERRKIAEQNLTLKLQLLQMRLSLINFAATGNIRDNKSEQVIGQILGLVPIGTLPGHLNRILFFARSNESGKALADCESIIRLEQDFSLAGNPNYLLDGKAVFLLNQLNIKVLEEMQKPSPSLNSLLPLINGARTEIEKQPPSPTRTALLSKLKGETAFLESLREAIDRGIEENELYIAARRDGGIRENIQQISGLAGTIKGLIDAERTEEVPAAIEAFLSELDKDPQGSDFYQQLPDILRTIPWSYYDKTDPLPAISILQELLGEEHLEYSQVASTLRVIRDKQTKNFLSANFEDSEFRYLAQASVADMYFYAGLYQKDKNDAQSRQYLESSRRYYLRAMGIDPAAEVSSLEELIRLSVARDPRNQDLAEKLTQINNALSAISLKQNQQFAQWFMRNFMGMDGGSLNASS